MKREIKYDWQFRSRKLNMLAYSFPSRSVFEAEKRKMQTQRISEFWKSRDVIGWIYVFRYEDVKKHCNIKILDYICHAITELPGKENGTTVVRYSCA